MNETVRVRIAPSPTGDPHVGTAYIALFNLAFAKSKGGKFILRIEDTDQSRARQDSERMIMESLKWLGLDWDEGPDVGGGFGPYRQSERKNIYQEHANQLVGKGHAYIEEGTENVVRLKMPDEGHTEFIDFLRGEIKFENKGQNDPVLIKSDGFPTYHLASVVDDHLMEISHVIRAEEWISSTPKHQRLYECFGWKPPVWVHMPLLRNKDKSKISKRKNPVSLEYYKQAGILPEALRNFLALMGWSLDAETEIFDFDEMTKAFSLKDVSLGSPVFDTQKLDWLNQQYIQKMENSQIVGFLRDNVFSETYLQKIAPLVKERLNRFEDFIDKNHFFFVGSLNYAELPIVPKGKESSEFKKILAALLEEFDATDDWCGPAIDTCIKNIKEEFSLKPKEIFMPLRLIATGRKDSPPLTETLEVLGKEVVRFRIREFISGL